MLFPPSDFTRSEIIHNLRYFPPASSFRSKFAYDNLLYIVAGELIPTITGVSWETFVQTRILDRLGTGCVATVSLTAGNQNVAMPHVLVGDKLTVVTPDPSTAYDPAGSIQCNATGMAAWAALQLADGHFKDGSTLFSAAQHKEMWTPQTIVAGLGDTAAMTQTHFRNYGLAWFIEDYQGAERVTHTGGLVGMVSYVSLLPEQHVGVIVLTNQQSGAAMSAMMQSLLDPFLGKPAQDWVGFWRTSRRRIASSRSERPRRPIMTQVRCDPVCRRARVPAAGGLRRRLSRCLARRRHGQKARRQAANDLQSNFRHAGRHAGHEGQCLRCALG